MRPEVFDLVQEEFRKFREAGDIRRSDHFLSSRLVCGDCGAFYGSKTWASTSKYKKVVWQCNDKYKKKGHVNCRTPYMTEEKIRWVFVEAFNRLISDKDRYIADYEPIIEALTDTAELESEAATVQERCDEMYTLVKAAVDENARKAQDQTEYQRHYEALVARYDAAKGRLADIQAEMLARSARRTKILAFLNELRGQEPLAEFSDVLWRRTVERVIVRSEREVAVEFRDGRQIIVNTFGR